jgi:hypothetical protein
MFSHPIRLELLFNRFREGNGMTDFYVRWGDDVQPYILQLASQHIETLGKYCKDAITRLLKCRKRKRAVVLVTARVKRSMMKAKAFHCFQMFGFDFELREGATKQKGRRQEFVLNFASPPDFAPLDMPPRLRRVDGMPLSARPDAKRRPRAAAPVRASGSRKGRVKKRRVERVSYHLQGFSLWIRKRSAALTSRLVAKLYKMYGLYQRLSARIAVMWRRRPRFDLVKSGMSFASSVRVLEVHAPIRARLEQRVIGESLRLLLFTFVSPEPSIDWSAYPFGRPAEEGERIAV